MATARLCAGEPVVRHLTTKAADGVTWALVGTRDGRAGWIDDARVLTDAVFIIDLYWKDLGGKPDWSIAAAAPGVAGAMLKATQGLSYPSKARAWFRKNWTALAQVCLERNGVSWFRAAYHYLEFNQSGAAQFDYHYKVVQSAGGYAPMDLPVVVDVERPEGSVNRKASRQQVVACVESFAERCHVVTGTWPILYAGSAMRDLGIKGLMRCSGLWTADYGETIDVAQLQKLGVTVKDLVFWQHVGDGRGKATQTLSGRTLYRQIPGFGACDLSVLTFGAGRIDDMLDLSGWVHTLDGRVA